MIEATSLEERKPFDRLLAAIVGVEKSGKSRLAATAEKPVLIHDFDGRADALAGVPGVYALTYRDVGGYAQPSAFTDFLSILAHSPGDFSTDSLGTVCLATGAATPDIEEAIRSMYETLQ